MSKHIIIDWQRDGLFVAMGTRRGNAVTIDTLVTTGGEGSNGSSTAISTQLFALAKQLDLNKCEATIIAPREVLEFRALTVPRGDANEVPDMVRFQAQRQMANIGDTWPLDYILLPDQPGAEGISALAATISPAHMAEIEASCSDLGLQLTRVLARPLEIARWGVMLGGLADTEASLVVAVSQTHADLLAVSFGSLVQVRGTRLPTDPAVMATALVAEIRRTIMAAANYLNGQAIAKIVLIAAPDIAERLESHVAEATGASVIVIDPASILPAKLPERHELAQRSASRLAALAGVISNTSSDRLNVIDLKNFKRPEPKKGYKREAIMASIAAGILLLLGTYWWWSSHAQLDLAIANAKKEEVSKADQVKTLAPKIKQRDDVDQFLAGSINWLDELKHVSQKAPASSDVMLSNPSFDLMVDRKGSLGQVSLMAEAKEMSTLGSLREGLGDKDHAVRGSGPKQMPVKKGDYAWTEKETIRLVPKAWDPLSKPATGQTKSAADAKPATTAKPAADAQPAVETKTVEAKSDKSEEIPTAAQPTANTAPPASAPPNTAPPNTAPPASAPPLATAPTSDVQPSVAPAVVPTAAPVPVTAPISATAPVSELAIPPATVPVDATIAPSAEPAKQ